MEYIFTNSRIVKFCQKTSGMLTLTLLLITAFLIPNQTAQAQLVCPEREIIQITDGQNRDSEDPSINADGTLIAFHSFVNITGGNPDMNREIFLFDTITEIYTQITDTPSTMVTNNDPSINAPGTLIAFDSNGNINGGNPDENREIFLADTTTGMITQITETATGDSDKASINAPGTRIAFRSDADFTGGNMDGNQEIFLVNVLTMTFTQVTDTMGGASKSNPDISADGARIAFEFDVTPGGDAQIFLADTTTGMITQITFTGLNLDPSISGDGTLIAFRSTANINGGNPDGNFEIYLFDTTTGLFTQITDTTSGRNDDPSISADGLRIAFSSSSNINGVISDGNEELYIYDRTTDTFTQITDEPSGGEDDSLEASTNADGTRIAFRSASDINGGNPQRRRQVWLATCLDPATARNIPTLSEWGLIAMAGVLGLIGILAIRRRKVTA